MASYTFPQSSDGDVEIYFSEQTVSTNRTSHVLALHSSWFKVNLSERRYRSAAGSAAGRADSVGVRMQV